jgi:hypothetical protein
MSIIHNNVTLTVAEVQAELDAFKKEDVFLYIDYIKNTDTGLVVKVEFSSDEDTEGAERWFQDSIVNPATGAVIPLEYTFAASGKYRIKIPNFQKEDKARVSISTPLIGATPGTVTVEGFKTSVPSA